MVRAEIDEIVLMQSRFRGLLTTTQLAAAGFNHNDIAQQIRDGCLVRLRRGIYAAGEYVKHCDARERYLLRLNALLLSAPGAYACDRSAAVLHGIPLLEADLSALPLEITWPGHKRGRQPQGERTRKRELPPGQVAAVDGIPVTTPARTVFDLAGSLPRTASLVACESAFFRIPRRHRPDVPLTTAAAAIAVGDGGPSSIGMSVARRNINAASDLSESPAETLLRQVMLSGGFDEYQQQIVVCDAAGAQLAQVDGYLPRWGIVLEADGMIKYQEDRYAFAREKRRHERLLDHGLIVIRADWTQIRHRPGSIIEAVHNAIGQRSRLARPVTAHLIAA